MSGNPKTRREIGKMDAAEGKIPDALTRKWQTERYSAKTREEVRDAGLAEKVNTRELKKQTAELAKQKKQRDGDNKRSSRRRLYCSAAVPVLSSAVSSAAH